MSEMTEDYNAGFKAGQYDLNRIVALKEDLAYEKGFNKGWQKSEYANKWISIKDEVPEEKVNLLYFFDCTGISLGQYYGIEEDYCPETGHVFASADGWLTGDVTHWTYIPDYPEGCEDHAEANAEYARVLKGDVSDMKEPIGGNIN